MRHLLPPVFLMVEPLPPLCRPARVVRHEGMTLVWAHPDTLCAEMPFWTRDNLDESERLAIRLAFEMQLDLSAPPDDHLLDGPMGDMVIPSDLRLPDCIQQPLQIQSA